MIDKVRKDMADGYGIELAHHLKVGNQAAVNGILNAVEPAAYENTFPGYMTGMLQRKHVKRSQLAQRANIARDYAYKLLRGVKRTKERDYILALCIGAGFTYGETEKALSLYPLPELGTSGRDMIIRAGISEGTDIDTINDWLSSQGMEPLRTYHEREERKIGPRRPTSPKNGNINSQCNAAKPQTGGFMRTIESGTWYEKYDCDIIRYYGETAIETDAGEVIYAQVSFCGGYSIFYRISRKSLKDGTPAESDIIENYSSEDPEAKQDNPYGFNAYLYVKSTASKSEYFRFFLELDYLTDKLVADTVFGYLDQDEKSGDATRFGYGKEKGRTFFFVETFNTMQPELSEYYQVRRYSSDDWRYTMSYTPAYEWFRYGRGVAEEPEFVISIRNIDDTPPEQSYALSGFAGLAHMLGIQLTKIGAGGANTEDIFRTEKVYNRVWTLGPERYLEERSKEKDIDPVEAAIQNKPPEISVECSPDGSEVFAEAEISLSSGKTEYVQLAITPDVTSFTVSDVSMDSGEWSIDTCIECHDSYPEERNSYVQQIRDLRKSAYHDIYLLLDDYVGRSLWAKGMGSYVYLKEMEDIIDERERDRKRTDKPLLNYAQVEEAWESRDYDEDLEIGDYEITAKDRLLNDKGNAIGFGYDYIDDLIEDLMDYLEPVRWYTAETPGSGKRTHKETAFRAEDLTGNIIRLSSAMGKTPFEAEASPDREYYDVDVFKKTGQLVPLEKKS